jgi:hypothetical protein
MSARQLAKSTCLRLSGDRILPVSPLAIVDKDPCRVIMPVARTQTSHQAQSFSKFAHTVSCEIMLM